MHYYFMAITFLYFSSKRIRSLHTSTKASRAFPLTMIYYVPPQELFHFSALLELSHILSKHFIFHIYLYYENMGRNVKNKMEQVVRCTLYYIFFKLKNSEEDANFHSWHRASRMKFAFIKLCFFILKDNEIMFVNMGA